MSKNRGQVSAAGAERLQFARIEQRYTTIRTAIRMAGFVGAAYMLSGIIETFAGTTTDFNLAVSFLADIKFAASLTLAGFAGLWGYLERRLRHQKTEQLQGRVRELEQRLDHNRSSSGLTTKGQTNPKDKRK